MKHLCCVLLALLAGCTAPAGSNAGAYVEARTASVFAGACHYGAEYTTAGREAVLAWRFDEGTARGAEVVAIVSSQHNLAEEREDRRSVVFVAGPDEACLEAVTALEARGWLGEVLSVREGAEIMTEGDRYEVRGGRELQLSGALLADRSCCSMPSKRWYRPIAATEPGVVGNSEVFRCDVPALTLRFDRTGDNDALVGSFAL